MQGIKVALLGLALAGAVAGGCESSRPPPEPLGLPAGAAQPPPPPLDVFSAERAWTDLLALSAPGRPTGEDPLGPLRTALEGLGLTLSEVSPAAGSAQGGTVLRHLTATLPGDSPDLFVLIAPHDGGGSATSPPLGGNEGISGAALLLELARVLSTRPSLYTVRFVFLAGEGRAGPTEPRWRGSLQLAEQMLESGELARTRLLVAFDRVCGPDLRIVRDLLSHRVYREEFFKAAKRLDRQDTFPAGQAFEQVEASHQAFLERGLRASVAIVGAPDGDDAGSGADAEGRAEPPADCVPESLEAVGVVTLEALDTIARRLAKIDRFARSPLIEIGPAMAPEPEPSPAEPAADLEATPPTDPDAEPPHETGESSG